MARNPDTIQREIEQTRDQLALSLDSLGDRANPKRLIAEGRQSVQEKLAEPKIRYALIAVGVLVAIKVLRGLFR
ncbi:MAG: DUF3618 domain-containing protein [Pseudonocardia sp.]